MSESKYHRPRISLEGRSIRGGGGVGVCNKLLEFLWEGGASIHPILASKYILVYRSNFEHLLNSVKRCSLGVSLGTSHVSADDELTTSLGTLIVYHSLLLKAVAWDHEAMYACVCDSSWEVGLGAGQRQQAEYFGADCSKSECKTLKLHSVGI